MPYQLLAVAGTQCPGRRSRYFKKHLFSSVEVLAFRVVLILLSNINNIKMALSMRLAPMKISSHIFLAINEVCMAELTFRLARLPGHNEDAFYSSYRDARF